MELQVVKQRRGEIYDALSCIRLIAGAFLAEAYGKPAQALIGDGEKPLRFVLESAFTRGSDEPAD